MNWLDLLPTITINSVHFISSYYANIYGMN
uniref:Uncharacterized protein n=1 Tax=viral metagenome TaxID=1070528 RepID=A0A6C0BKB7_9ZZZZ